MEAGGASVIERNRVHNQVDGVGLHISGILSDRFGMNGRCILDRPVAGMPPAHMIDSLSGHAEEKKELLQTALGEGLQPR